MVQIDIGMVDRAERRRCGSISGEKVASYHSKIVGASQRLIWQDTMKKSPRRLHVGKLRKLAVFKIVSEGTHEGYCEFGGLDRRIRRLEKYPLFCEYLSPRHPTGVDRGEPKPTTYSLKVTGPHGVVLNVGWDGDRMLIRKYIPGSWERIL